MLRIILLLFLVLGLGFFFIYRYSLTQSDFPVHIKAKKALEKGDLSLSFRGLDNKKLFNIAGFFGEKWVLLNFWATWCAPCVEELPSLIALSRAFPSQLVVLALSTEREDEVNYFLKDRSYPSSFIVGLTDTLEMARVFQVRALPESFLFNPTGELIERVRGERMWDSKEQMEKLKAYFLQEK